ncbi:MAG: NifB/NifX family molybdenum-iron cluster-binding protein [Vulcanisaeta sp.]
MNDVICTTVNDDLSFDVFSRAKYLVLIEDGVVIHREVNPALNSRSKRPAVAKRCVELRANVVLAPHGSLCFPSFSILRRAGITMYVVRPGDKFGNELSYLPVNIGEVVYSSFLAIIERIREVFGHE